MKKIITLIVAALVCGDALACTSAIVSASKTLNGRPLMWKHRDTGEEDNKVERVPASADGLEYVALFNASDRDLASAWMGYNARGFAIMNTASYNLKNDTVPASQMDREGELMTKALRACATVDDFEALLQRLPKPLYVEANFGVIDAQGNGAYFETNNFEYHRYDLKDAPDGVLYRTNYSYAGAEGKGMGYIREQNEMYLLRPHVQAADITPLTFVEGISKTYYHSQLQHDFTHDNDTWLIDQDFIPRFTSSASCCIEGVNAGDNPALTAMWIGLGFPPCSELRMALLGDGGVPDDIRGTLPDGHSPLCDQVVRRKHEVFSIARGSGKKYFNMALLYNAQGTGYCQQLIPQNTKRYYQYRQQLQQRAQALQPAKTKKKKK